MVENRNTNSVSLTSDLTKLENDKRFKVKAAIFLSAVTGVSALIGFGTTVMSAKKKDAEFFSKGLVGSVEMTETGASLALRALGWGTLYAVTGCGILFYTIWKISGANDLKEFRCKAGSILPKISRNDPPQTRTEFSGMNDLLTYLSSQRSKKD